MRPSDSFWLTQTQMQPASASLAPEQTRHCGFWGKESLAEASKGDRIILIQVLGPCPQAWICTSLHFPELDDQLWVLPDGHFHAQVGGLVFVGK